VASSITLTGALLSLGLGPDGGSRGGAIHLSPDKEHSPLPLSTVEEEPLSPPAPEGLVSQLKRKASRRFSDALARRIFDGPTGSPRPGGAVLSPLTPVVSPPKQRTMSRTSKVNGSAYGYSSSRVGSMSGARRPSFASTLRQRRYTNASQQQRPGTPSSFAHRLLLGGYSSKYLI
jgi:hypothetical protein